MRYLIIEFVMVVGYIGLREFLFSKKYFNNSVFSFAASIGWQLSRPWTNKSEIVTSYHFETMSFPSLE
jgi:hypothetical protein